MKSKDRIPHRSLTNEIVLDARRRLHEGRVALWELVVEYEVGYYALRNAVKGKTWAHLNRFVEPVEKDLSYGRRGVFHPGSVITDAVVLEARRLAREGWGTEEIVGESGLPPSGLEQAIRGENWTHLDEIEPPVVKPRGGVLGNHGGGPRKLPREDIPVIRERAAIGEDLWAIAEDYGVHRQTILDVVNRKTWRHID